ncbi:MAG: cysteine desulfurase [Deferribacteraceae bacterium]|jgi:cysteine desulfurase|nr:cysteine desulfurase [Deferribacteraceae bacterium]
MIYMDNMAGTKPDPRVVAAVTPWITEKYGNPSAHFYPLGRESYVAIEAARASVATMLNAPKAEQIIFTANGTESNNVAIKGYLPTATKLGKKHIIISEIEHFSIQNIFAKLLKDGWEVTKLRVGDSGIVNPDDLKKAIRKDTALVSIAQANPEIGVIQDSVEIGKICKEAGVIYHVDAVASCGRIPVDVQAMNADLVSVAAQNFYGVRGAAALYVSPEVKLKPLFDGGYQERGMRSGSENVAAIVGMGVAADLVTQEMADYAPKMAELGRHFADGIGNMFDFLHFTGSMTKRLPGHVSFWIEFVEGESLLMWYALNNIYAASGSACSSNILAHDEEDLVASHVLTAVGVPTDICAGSMMFSMSKYTTKEDVDKVLEVTPGIVNKLTAMSPHYNR